VVPLKYVGAREMVRLLQPFAADNTVVPDDVRNLVIVAGNERELRHVIDTIELFDVDWLSGYSIGLFPIKSADVKTLVTDLDRIFGAAAQSPLAGLGYRFAKRGGKCVNEFHCHRWIIVVRGADLNGGRPGNESRCRFGASSQIELSGGWNVQPAS